MRKFQLAAFILGAVTLAGCGSHETKLNEDTAHHFMVQYLYDVECADMTADEVAGKYAAMDTDKARILTLYQQERTGIVGMVFKENFCPKWDMKKQLAISRMVPDGDGFRDEFENEGAMQSRPERVVKKDGALKITFE